jgi:hypothetical protein
MEDKKLYMMGVTLGSFLGGYIPLLWGNNEFVSMSGVFATAFGGLAGIYIVYQILK